MGWVKPYQYSILSLELEPYTERRKRCRCAGWVLGSIWAVSVLCWSIWSSQVSFAGSVDTVRADWAYYNPISLVLKEKKWLEEDLGDRKSVV